MASSSSSAAASNANSASSPWEVITIGKGTSQQLKDQFEMNYHGGLTCLGCGRMHLRGDLEKASRAVSTLLGLEWGGSDGVAAWDLYYQGGLFV